MPPFDLSCNAETVPLSMDKSVFTSGPSIHAPSPKIVAMLTLQLWARSIPAALSRPGADKVAFEFGELAKISFSKGPAMIRDEDAALTGYVYLDLNTRDYGGFVSRADRLLREKLQLPAGYSLKWSGEYEFELRAKERLKIILPIVFLAIFMLLYMVFRSVTEALVLIFPTLYAMTGGLLLQW